MFYKYFAVLAIVFLLIPTLNAQEVDRSGGYARVQALGENPYVVDPEFMKINPAWGQFYDNFLWADIGDDGSTNGDYPGGDGQFFGLNFRLDSDWTLGALMSRDDFRSMSIGTLDPYQITQLHNPRLNNNIEVFSSLRMGNTSFGLGLSYAKASTDHTVAEENTTTSASQIGVNLGLLSNFSRGTMLDLGVSVLLPSYSAEQTLGDAEVSQTIIGANARFFWGLSNKVRLVPAVNFLTATGTSDFGDESADLPSYMALGAGVGLEYTVGDFMLIGGPAFRMSSVTDDDPEVSTTSFPIWNIGAEWNATEWLIARVGYVAETGSETETMENDDEHIMTFYRPGEVTLGLGFRFGDFGLDATIRSSVLRGGLANIGGEPTFAYLSASYGF